LRGQFGRVRGRIYFAQSTLATRVQIGTYTATPKRPRIYADTYDYFGKPVYEYSLREGGLMMLLTPFARSPIFSTIDSYNVV